MTAAFPSLVESIRLQTRFSIPVVSTFMKRIFFSGSLSLCCQVSLRCCYFCKANSFAFEREYASILHWVGEVGKSFEQQQHIDFLVMLSSFSSSALLILLFSSTSSSFSSPQIQKQFLNLQCSLEVWFFSPWFSSLLSFNGSFFSKTKVEKPIRKLISRLTFLLSLPLMK